MLKLSIIILLLAHSCTSKTTQESDNFDTNEKVESTLHALPMINKQSWRQSYDFDMDEKVDSIFYTYSAGAHCCYSLSIKLSSNQKTTEIPHLIEGGYLGGLDLSQVDNFNIFDIDQDKQAEIFISGLPYDTNSQDIYVDFEKKDKYYTEIKYKVIQKK